ncbi:MAG: hypothetical protein Q4B73_09105 [Lachnospiraceae bacterium]|nr:hypothetical protein [Lachnospiraceae bacterium]
MIKKRKEKNNLSPEKRAKRMLTASVVSCIVAVLALIIVTFSWLSYRRALESLTWIKIPITLDIQSGDNHNIAYMDMGNIDADQGEKTYVFCVYGEPVDIYSLQLAYTTNIAFYYDVYRADLASGSGDVAFSFTDAGGDHTEWFNYVKDGSGNIAAPVISAKPVHALTSAQVAEHQSHRLSYGDEKGLNPISTDKVQSNAQPLYWLANENGMSVLNPRNIQFRDAMNQYFCDYYIIKVRWDPGTVENDKETDMVYLTASR